VERADSSKYRVSQRQSADMTDAQAPQCLRKWCTQKVSAEFHSRHFHSSTIAATAFRALREREIEKYPSTAGFEPGILTLTASMLTTFAQKMTDCNNLFRRLESKMILEKHQYEDSNKKGSDDRVSLDKTI